MVGSALVYELKLCVHAESAGCCPLSVQVHFSEVAPQNQTGSFSLRNANVIPPRSPLHICQLFLHCFLSLHGLNERLLQGHVSRLGLVDPCFCFVQPGFISLDTSGVSRKFLVNFLFEIFEFIFMSSLSSSLRVCRSTLCSVLKSRISLLIL